MRSCQAAVAYKKAARKCTVLVEPCLLRANRAMARRFRLRLLWCVNWEPDAIPHSGSSAFLAKISQLYRYRFSSSVAHSSVLHGLDKLYFFAMKADGQSFARVHCSHHGLRARQMARPW